MSTNDPEGKANPPPIFKKTESFHDEPGEIDKTDELPPESKLVQQAIVSNLAPIQGNQVASVVVKPDSSVENPPETIDSTPATFVPGPNEPSTYVSLEEVEKLSLGEQANEIISNKEKDPNAPNIGWSSLTTAPNVNPAEINAKVNHLMNTSVIYVAVILTWLGCLLGGGVAWCLVVVACCSNYYRNTVERYKRCARDDAIRELWVQKLENETETVAWLNNFLDRFWVIYEPGLSSTIKSIVDSVLEISTPPFLESLTLTTFQLGNKAPRIHAVRTFPNTEPDVVLMDWEIEFMPSNDMDMTKREISNQINPKVVLQIRVGKGMVGAGMPVLVENFALKGTMRVKITFGSTFPHVEMVGLQFLAPPEIDYVLKPVGGDTFGFDIAHIPGLSSFIRDQIHAILAPMMYMPNEFLLNVGQIMNPLPVNEVLGILKATVRYARDLKVKDGSGDLYVSASTTTREKIDKTSNKIQASKLNWNEVLNIVIYKEDQEVKFTVFGCGSFRSDFECGSTSLSLNSFLEKPVQSGLTQNLKRDNVYVGALTLDLQFFAAQPEYKTSDASADQFVQHKSGILRFTLHQIKDLDASKSMIGKFTPYAYILVNSVEKHKTKKKKRNNNPVFEETVEIVVTDINTCTLAVNVKDDKGMAVDPIVAKWSSNATKVITNSGWFPLNNVTTGKVKVTAKWFPVELDGSQSLVHATSGNYFGVVYLNLMEVPKLKLATSRSEVYIDVYLSNTFKFRTQPQRADVLPRFNENVTLFIDSPTDTIRFDVVEQSGMDRFSVGSIELPILRLAIKHDDDYVARDTMNFWMPVQSKNNSFKGAVHFGASLYVAEPVSHTPLQPTLLVSDSASLVSKENKFAVGDASDASKSKESLIESLPKSCILTLTVHEAKGLPSQNILSAAVFLNGTNSELAFETHPKRDTENPKWERADPIFIRNTDDQLSVIVRDNNSVFGRFEMPVSEVYKLKEKSRQWFKIGENSELQLSFKFQKVDYELLPDLDKLLSCGRITVDLVNASNLIAVDMSGTSDPFVRGRINGCKVFKSQVFKKNLNPRFDERFTVPLLDVVSSELVLEVYDWNKINASEKLGYVRIPLDDVIQLGQLDNTYNLEGVRHGQLTVKIGFEYCSLSDEEIQLGIDYTLGSASLVRRNSTMTVDSATIAERATTANTVNNVVSAEQLLENAMASGKSMAPQESMGKPGNLEVKVIGAEKLIAVDRGGTSDPYLKIKRDGSLVFTTSIIKKNCNPTWNEVFSLQLNSGAPCYLDLSMMDHNRIQTDVNLGITRINIWDYVKIEDPATYTTQFFTPELKGGEPGRVELQLTFIPA